VLILLYAFLVGVGLLEAGIAALGKGFQAGLLESVSNPISGLCAGLLATVLVQSSSVSTSTIVGLVGAGTLPLGLAVPMVMGANIGTTVTSTLAALGSIRRADEFQRAFAAATVHDFFNILAVAVLLPLEIATGLLQRMAAGLTGVALDAGLRASEPGKSPIRAAVKLPVQWVEGLLPGGGLTAVILLVVGLAVIFLALGLITRNMRRLVAGGVERVMNRVVGKGGGLVGILAGIAVTVAVQSSSITTSILVPLVGAGVLTLASAYPITLGANVGTTITALLASLAVVRPEGLTIALVHLLFNVVGILILYPLPILRVVPIRLAEGLAVAAVKRTRVVIAYIVIVFLMLPLLGVFLIK
jgi:sodium-dependent phosphate cotransporter